MKHVFWIIVALLLLVPDQSNADAGLERIRRNFCEPAEAACDRKIDLFVIDPNSYRLGLTTAGEGNRIKQTTFGLFDTLLEYALDTQAFAVFNSGLLSQESSYAIPFGLLQIDGNRLFSRKFQWRDEGFLCITPDGIVISKEPKVLGGQYDCLQSGPVLFSRAVKTEALELRLDPSVHPQGAWTKRQRISAIAQLSDGKVAMVYAQDHSYAEVSEFLAQLKVGSNKVKHALGLSVGDYTGYIVRTEGQPLIVGNEKQFYPYAITVSGK